MAVFQFQAADADMDRWKADAARRSVSFAAYIRSLLDSSGSQVSRPTGREPTSPMPAQAPVDPKPTIAQLPQAPSGKRSFAPDPK